MTLQLGTAIELDGFDATLLDALTAQRARMEKESDGFTATDWGAPTRSRAARMRSWREPMHSRPLRTSTTSSWRCTSSTS